MIEIEFELHLLVDGDLSQVPERSLRDQADHYFQLAEAQQSLEGMLRIRQSEQGEMELADDLSSLVQRLCFGAIPALVDEPESTIEYRFFSQDERLVMTPDGDRMRLFVEEEPELLVPRYELAMSLFACGNRFLDLLTTVDGRLLQLRDYLQAFADEAQPYVERIDR